MPAGFFSTKELLGEGATAPSISTFAGIVVPVLPTFPIYAVDGTEFPRLLFEHQATPAAMDEAAGLRQMGSLFGTRVVDGHALRTITTDNDIEALFIPSDDNIHSTQDLLLCLAHRSAAAHFGGLRTFHQLMDAHVWWPTMRADAFAFARCCLNCDRIRGGSSYYAQGSLQHISTKQVSDRKNKSLSFTTSPSFTLSSLLISQIEKEIEEKEAHLGAFHDDGVPVAYGSLSAKEAHALGLPLPSRVLKEINNHCRPSRRSTRHI